MAVRQIVGANPRGLHIQRAAFLGAPAGRQAVVDDDGEVPENLVCDMVEVLTSFCARS